MESYQGVHHEDMFMPHAYAPFDFTLLDRPGSGPSPRPTDSKADFHKGHSGLFGLDSNEMESQAQGGHLNSSNDWPYNFYSNSVMPGGVPRCQTDGCTAKASSGCSHSRCALCCTSSNFSCGTHQARRGGFTFIPQDKLTSWKAGNGVTQSGTGAGSGQILNGSMQDSRGWAGGGEIGGDDRGRVNGSTAGKWPDSWQATPGDGTGVNGCVDEQEAGTQQAASGSQYWRQLLTDPDVEEEWGEEVGVAAASNGWEGGGGSVWPPQEVDMSGFQRTNGRSQQPEWGSGYEDISALGQGLDLAVLLEQEARRLQADLGPSQQQYQGGGGGFDRNSIGLGANGRAKLGVQRNGKMAPKAAEGGQRHVSEDRPWMVGGGVQGVDRQKWGAGDALQSRESGAGQAGQLQMDLGFKGQDREERGKTKSVQRQGNGILWGSVGGGRRVTDYVRSTAGAGIEDSWQHDMWQPAASSVGNGGDEFLRQMLNQGTATGLSKSVHVRQSNQATQEMEGAWQGGQSTGAGQQAGRIGGGWVDAAGMIWSQPQANQTAVPQAVSNGNAPVVKPRPPQQNQQQHFQFLRGGSNAADVQFQGTQQKEYSSFESLPTPNLTGQSGYQPQQAANGGGGGAQAEQGGGKAKKQKVQRNGGANKLSTSGQQVSYFPPRVPDTRPAGTSGNLQAPSGTTGGSQFVVPAGAAQAKSQSYSGQEAGKQREAVKERAWQQTANYIAAQPQPGAAAGWGSSGLVTAKPPMWVANGAPPPNNGSQSRVEPGKAAAGRNESLGDQGGLSQERGGAQNGTGAPACSSQRGGGQGRGRGRGRGVEKAAEIVVVGRGRGRGVRGEGRGKRLRKKAGQVSAVEAPKPPSGTGVGGEHTPPVQTNGLQPSVYSSQGAWAGDMRTGAFENMPGSMYRFGNNGPSQQRQVGPSQAPIVHQWGHLAHPQGQVAPQLRQVAPLQNQAALRGGQVAVPQHGQAMVRSFQGQVAYPARQVAAQQQNQNGVGQEQPEHHSKLPGNFLAETGFGRPLADSFPPNHPWMAPGGRAQGQQGESLPPPGDSRLPYHFQANGKVAGGHVAPLRKCPVTGGTSGEEGLTTQSGKGRGDGGGSWGGGLGGTVVENSGQKVPMDWLAGGGQGGVSGSGSVQVRVPEREVAGGQKGEVRRSVTKVARAGQIGEFVSSGRVEKEARAAEGRRKREEEKQAKVAERQKQRERKEATKLKLRVEKAEKKAADAKAAREIYQKVLQMGGGGMKKGGGGGAETTGRQAVGGDVARGVGGGAPAHNGTPGGASNGVGKGGWGFVGLIPTSTAAPGQAQVKDGSRLPGGKAGGGEGKSTPGQGRNGVRADESLPPQREGALLVGVPPQRVSPLDLKRRAQVLPAQPGLDVGPTSGCVVVEGSEANGRTPPQPSVKEEVEEAGAIPWHILTETPAKLPSVKEAEAVWATAVGRSADETGVGGEEFLVLKTLYPAGPPATKYSVVNTHRLPPSATGGLRAPGWVTQAEVMSDRALRRLRVGALAMQQLAPPLPSPLLNSKKKGDREAAAYEAARVGLGEAHMWLKGQVAVAGEGEERETKVEMKEERGEVGEEAEAKSGSWRKWHEGIEARLARLDASSALSDITHLRSTVEQIQVSVRLARRHGVGFPLEEERGWTPREKRRKWAEELKSAHATQVEERPVVAQLVAGVGKGQAVHQM